MKAPTRNFTFVIHPDRIIEALRPLVDRLPMTLLQDNLVAEGFIENTGGREAFWRACDTPGRFWATISEKLNSPADRDAVRRILRGIVDECLCLGTVLRLRVRALRRGQQALKQADVGSVMRSLEALEAFRDEPGLSDSRILLYLLARTESARQIIVRLMPMRKLLLQPNAQIVEAATPTNAKAVIAPIESRVI